VLDRCLRTVEGALQIGADDRIPVVLRHHHDQHITGNPCIVYQYVEIAEGINRKLD
jgi:hypothetical protein